MSYSQILRRINRLLQATITDAIDNLSIGDKQDLDDFDRELRQEKERTQYAKRETSDKKRPGAGGSGTGGPGSGTRKEGRRKPGEKDDAHYYAILGLTPSASQAEIKKAYRTLMSLYHPDRVATLGEDLRHAATEKAKLVNEAYHIIERRRGFK
ncbi:MAG: DnaJ domain-containing protein [Bacteroidetes bacterium]|nr:DnaJ domain-containing protein [Bacteroidota bacterium]